MKTVFRYLALILTCSGVTGQAICSAQQYQVVVAGADSVLHSPGNAQLWYDATNGASEKVWGYLVGDPIVFEEYAIFNGGLSDANRWKTYPALFVHEPSKGVMEITECITKQFSLSKGASYEKLRGVYRYGLSGVGKTFPFELTGWREKSTADAPLNIKVTVSKEDIDSWIQSNTAVKGTNEYDGVFYTVLTGDALIQKNSR